jgi:hypothetical protein
VICPRCHAEFRPGFTVCSDCGVALVEELGEAVAEVEDEGVEALAPFHETWSSDELAAILEAFEEQSVAYVVQAGTALSLLTQEVEPSALPEEWHARILVAGVHQRRAREILLELRRQALAARSAPRGAADGLPG